MGKRTAVEEQILQYVYKYEKGNISDNVESRVAVTSLEEQGLLTVNREKERWRIQADIPKRKKNYLLPVEHQYRNQLFKTYQKGYFSPTKLFYSSCQIFI